MLKQDSQHCCLLIRVCCKSAQGTENNEVCAIRSQQSKLDCHVNCSGGVGEGCTQELRDEINTCRLTVYDHGFDGTHHVFGSRLRRKGHLWLILRNLIRRSSGRNGRSRRNEVAEIVARFARLNPYTDKSRSILKIERDNYDPKTGEQRQVYCLAVSSKRYGLFLRDEEGNPVLLQKGLNNHEDRWSEHGLGHLRNPMNPDSEDRDWIRQAWINIIRVTLGLPVEPLGFEHLPAIGRVPITSPAALRSLAKLNRGRKYRNRIKPFDFLLSCHVKPFGHPPDVDPEKFHLVAPYVPDPECWVDLPWIDQYSGKQYEITTEGFHGTRGVARVKTYGEVLREYESHLGAKSADAKGKPSSKQTVGMLHRRHVRVERIIHIGKESNRLEEIEAGVIHSPESVYTEYPDPSRDEWQTRILPILKKIPISILKRFSGRSRSMLQRTIAGRTRPRKRNREQLKSIVHRLGAV